MSVLPPVLIAYDGRGLAWPSVGGTAPPVYLRDIDLSALTAIVEGGRRVDAVDLDSIAGIKPDLAAARFVTMDLEIGVVATRRYSTACWVAEHGRTALLHLSAFDSTGLERGLAQHPGGSGIGTLISPGPALKYLGDARLARLPAPIVAYGLILSMSTARELQHLANTVIVSQKVAGALRREPEGR